MEHTPGPWKAYKKNGRNGYSIHGAVGSPNENQIAHVRGTCIGNTMKKMDEEEVANARLIAAAPELLASLERILEWIDRGCDPSKTSIERALAAIAHAKGKEA